MVYPLADVRQTMGERTCYRAFCPACDAPVSVADRTCPDCGTELP